jgi:integrase
MGSVFQREGSDCWWISYYHNGIRHRESSESVRKADAIALLKQRLSDIEQGRPVGTTVRNTTFEDLIELVKTDYAINNRHMDLRGPIKHLSNRFAGWLASDLSTAAIQKYSHDRLHAGASPATVNRELATLRRGFTLGARSGLVGVLPVFTSLVESNTRKGFFEREQFEAVLTHLPDYMKPVMRVAYITGWRTQSEILTRLKSHVDLQAGWLRLDPNETKNKQGRMFPIIPELRAVLEEVLAATRRQEMRDGVIIPYLFHRHGHRIRSYRRCWATACEKAGLPGRLVHDFRRTAVRNLERSGISRSAAMKMTGHLTESVYRRYAIVDEVMLREAGEKLSAFHRR